MGQNTKTCSKCGEDFPATTEYFHKAKHGKFGLRADCKSCNYKRCRNWKRKNSEKCKKWELENKERLKKYRREWKLKKYYNLTTEKWQEMFDEQKGCCAICGLHQTKVKLTLVVDHSHKTGEIRKLLCHYCNRQLGWYENNKDRIEQYLQFFED